MSKGDVGLPAKCPLCGVTVLPQKVYKVRGAHGNHRWTSSRTVTRRAVANHLINVHPGLGVRERSLILDRVCKELGL